MFNTKLEVDRHIKNCLRKINNELQKNLRCFTFAKLYYKVGDYNSAHHYISRYLNVKNSSAEGQQFLGKILEMLGKKVEALNAYRTSLTIDPMQNSLVIKVCELMASDDVNLVQADVQTKYICKLAESFDPYNPVLLKLKARLVTLNSKNSMEVTQLLLKELEAQPLDVDTRVRLLRHLLQHKQIKEAYNHAYDIEKKYLSIFLNNFNWYETLAEVLICYQRENSISKVLTWEYWMLLISVLDKLVSLSFYEQSISIKNNTKAVLNFDQTLQIAVDNINSCPEKQLIAEFINHYSGQLCLHLITLFFKYARQNLIKYKESIQVSISLLFAAYSFQPSDLESIWLQHATESSKQQVQRWYKEAAFRCSQIGHIIISNDKSNSILVRAKQGAMGLWREHVFKIFIVTRDEKLKLKTSFFMKSEQFEDISIQLPNTNDLVKYDNVAQLVFPSSLHHYIWIGFQQELAQLNCFAFNELNYSLKNLNNCAGESLNVLDIQSFIYCSVLCAQAEIKEYKHMIYNNMENDSMIPVSIMSMLGSANQNKWLKCAYKMFSNRYNSELSDVQQTLIRGIEVVRCNGNHGLDVKLLICLAKIFEERAKKLTIQSEIEFNYDRAELYWKAALPLLEKLKRNQAVSYSTSRLFEYKIKELTQTEIQLNIDAARLFIATHLMKQKEYEKAMQIFKTLNDPYASFHQSQICKLMTQEETNIKNENISSEMYKQQIILLTKARNYLYITMDRLCNPNINKNHPLNSILETEIEKINCLMSHIDPDAHLSREECKEMSHENFYNNSYRNEILIPPQNNTNIHSNPSSYITRRTTFNDVPLNHILDQNKIMIESHKNLANELKSFREAVSTLTININDVVRSNVENIKHIKVTVDKFKVSVNDLQCNKSVTDLVCEMRKDIYELKKDMNQIKSNLMRGNVLDEKYKTKYSRTRTNISSQASSIYSNLGRMVPPNRSCSIPPAHYSNAGYYPPIYSMYPYNCGLPQVGALPFAAEFHLPDTMAVSAFTSKENEKVVLRENAKLFRYVKKEWKERGAGKLKLLKNSKNGKIRLVLRCDQVYKICANHYLSKDMAMKQICKNEQAYIWTANDFSKGKIVHEKFCVQFKTLDIAKSFFKEFEHSKILIAKKVDNKSVYFGGFKFTSTPKFRQKKEKPVVTSIDTKADIPKIVNPFASFSFLNDKILDHSNKIKLTDKDINICEYPKEDTTLAQKKFSRSKSLDTVLKYTFCIQPMIEAKTNSILNNNSGLQHKISTRDTQQTNADNIYIKSPITLTYVVESTMEEEHVLYCHKAKLFRYIDHQWKEGGIGDLKILRNTKTNKLRVLMHNEQKHKIYLNHILTDNLVYNWKDDKIWLFSTAVYSKACCEYQNICLQFKTPEIAKQFMQVVDEALRKSLYDLDNPFATIGAGTPVFAPQKKPTTPPQNKKYEENEEVLFTHKGKLYRFDNKEWTERGVGDIKLLYSPETRIYRLLLRREVIHKIILNQRISSNLDIQSFKKSANTWMWAGYNFCDNKMLFEKLAVKFKDENIFVRFYETIRKAIEKVRSEQNIK